MGTFHSFLFKRHHTKEKTSAGGGVEGKYAYTPGKTIK